MEDPPSTEEKLGKVIKQPPDRMDPKEPEGHICSAHCENYENYDVFLGSTPSQVS